MVKSNKSYLKEEKWFSKQIKKLPYLYDKGNEGYK